MTQLDEAFRAVWRDIANLAARTERLETQEGHTFSAVNVGANTGAVTGEVKATTLTANKTRRIDLIPIFDRRTNAPVTFAADTHGSFANITHIDQADADVNYKVVGFKPVVWPTDYVAGTATFKWMALSGAAGGNYVWDVYIVEFANAGTAVTTLNNTSEIVATTTAANTMTIHSKALTVNPTADRVMWLELAINSNHVSDTSTGTRALYDCWLEYTATL